MTVTRNPATGDIDFEPRGNPRSDMLNKGVACHMTECRTTDLGLCRFPFRYKGRLYSSCITLDSDYTWCSLNTDDNDNHIDDGTSRGECQESCLVTNCPIGFFHQNGNCYHISAMTIHDMVKNEEEAETICNDLGSRLYQPRDYNLDGDFMKSEETFFTNLFLSYATSTPQFMAIGAKTKNFPTTGEVFYNDGTRAYFLESKITAQGNLQSSTVADLSATTDTICIFLTNNGVIQAEKCKDYTSDIPLGYICEAKPLITIDGNEIGKSCHFPFHTKADKSDLFHSCIYNETARYSWCFTELDTDNIGITDKTGICPDEREITYDGPGGGKQCYLPFLSDRVWYDQCAIDPREEIWCPTILSNPNRMFDEENDEYGLCTGYLASSNPNCNANYDLVGGKCIRVSPFAENFRAASEKCRSEGSYLLTILDNTIIPPLKTHIDIISNSKVQFLPQYSPDISSYWVGGVVENSVWTWESNGKNYSLYSDWLDKKENEGCVLNKCTDNYRLMLDVNKKYAWQAADMNIEKPYICESKCQSGFLWFRGAEKCLKVVGKKAQSTISDALYQCSKMNSRLVSFETCRESDNLPDDLKRMLTQTSDEYWTGIYTNGLENLFPRRLTKETKTVRPVIRSDGYASVKDCASLPDSSGTDAEIGYFEYERPTITLKFAGLDTLDERGYICEEEFDWICPQGYWLFQEDCYKLFERPSKFSDALIDCRNEGGFLTEVPTDFHKLFLIELIKNQNSSNTDIWTGYRKDPANFATDPDLIYHSTLNDIVTFASAAGKFYPITESLTVNLKYM